MSTLTTTLTVRLTHDERQAAEAYAREKRLTLAQLVRESIIEKIEDSYDLEIYTEWLKSKRETVTFESLMEDCGFSEQDLQ